MPLYTTSGDTNFNCALECLLDCMKILLAKLERDYIQESSHMKIKSTDIDKDKIKGASIKYEKNDEDQWSSACKYFLIGLQGICLISKKVD